MPDKSKEKKKKEKDIDRCFVMPKPEKKPDKKLEKKPVKSKPEKKPAQEDGRSLAEQDKSPLRWLACAPPGRRGKKDDKQPEEEGERKGSSKDKDVERRKVRNDKGLYAMEKVSRRVPDGGRSKGKVDGAARKNARGSGRADGGGCDDKDNDDGRAGSVRSESVQPKAAYVEDVEEGRAKSVHEERGKDDALQGGGEQGSGGLQGGGGDGGKRGGSRCEAVHGGGGVRSDGGEGSPFPASASPASPSPVSPLSSSPSPPSSSPPSPSLPSAGQDNAKDGES